MTQPTTDISRAGARTGGLRLVARLRQGTRRAAVIAATGLMLTGAPAAADGFKDAVVQQLVEQGFREFRISRTLLGRTRVIATSKTLRREIIFNPVTGEILRDYWRDKNEGERLIRRAGGESGLREKLAPSLVDPADPPSATAAIAPSDDPGDSDGDTTGDANTAAGSAGDAGVGAGDQDNADSGGNLSDGDASSSSGDAGDGKADGSADSADGNSGADAGGGDSDGGADGGNDGGADAGGDAGGADGGADGGSSETPG